MKRREEAFAAIAFTIFLLLVAWGNATAMFVVSAIGCLVGLGVLWGRAFRGRLLVAATAAFAVAATIAIAIVMILGRGH